MVKLMFNSFETAFSEGLFACFVFEPCYVIGDQLHFVLMKITAKTAGNVVTFNPDYSMTD